MATLNEVAVGEFQIYRAFFMFCCISATLPFTQKNPCTSLPRKHYRAMALRSLFGMVNFMAFNWGISMIPLSLAVIMFNLSPFWTALLGKWFNNEPIFPLEYFAMTICFACVVGVTLLKPKTD